MWWLLLETYFMIFQMTTTQATLHTETVCKYCGRGIGHNFIIHYRNARHLVNNTLLPYPCNLLSYSPFYWMKEWMHQIAYTMATQHLSTVYTDDPFTTYTLHYILTNVIHSSPIINRHVSHICYEVITSKFYTLYTHVIFCIFIY